MSQSQSSPGGLPTYVRPLLTQLEETVDVKVATMASCKTVSSAAGPSGVGGCRTQRGTPCTKVGVS